MFPLFLEGTMKLIEAVFLSWGYRTCKWHIFIQTQVCPILYTGNGPNLQIITIVVFMVIYFNI